MEMNEAWFSAQVAPWFSMMSLFSLLAYLQAFALKGKYQRWVVGGYYAATGVALVVSFTGGVAYLLGQPNWVWGTLVFAGGLTFVLMLFANRKLNQIYADSELRKSIASDL